MKKTAFFIFMNFIAWSNAQLTDIKYIPAIATDTISTQARLYTSLLSANKFNPVVFERGIKVGKRRQNTTLRDKDIFYIEFVDKSMDKRVFKQVPELGLGTKLLEVMTIGKISWYRNYFNYKKDAWDQSIAYDDYFIKNKEIVKVPVTGKYKNKLKKLLNDQPQLAVEVDSFVNTQDIKEIIEKYNKD